MCEWFGFELGVSALNWSFSSKGSEGMIFRAEDGPFCIYKDGASSVNI